MKPLEKNDTLVSSVNNTTSFKMQTSRETFEIFSSQIYEHKIRAIIRELSCNANDAHVDAGKRDVPFRIHFPTIFEPYFEVEDFGVGLDDYDIRGEEKILYDKNGEEVSRYMEGGIYTTYFASTKRDSNESIGHLGLGSKSPLSYTKSMTLVARKNGVERHYVCFIGENGEPQTTFNSQKETDKGNGVSIRFSVAQDDFEEFKREAGFVLALFKLKPETNVTIDYKLNDSELSSIIDSGSLIIDDNHPFQNHEPAQVYCNMGGVVYPVRNLNYTYLANKVMVNEDAYNTGEDQEPEYYEFDRASVEFIKTMIDRDKRFIINYPLGDLSFMPSREGLSQDTQTKFNFYKQLVEVVGKEVKELQVNLDKTRQTLEAINLFSKFTDPWDRLGRNYYFGEKSIAEWINYKAFSNFRSDVDDADKFICHYKDSRGWFGGGGSTVVRRSNIFTYNYYDIHQLMEKQSSFVCYYANEADEYKGMSNAIRLYMNTKDIGHRVFFFYEPGCKTSAFKKFKDVFYGNIEFRHISTLVDEVKAIEPTFFDKKKRGGSKGSKARASRKNETKAVVIAYKSTARSNEERYKSSGKKVIVDLSRLNPKTTMYVDKVTQQGSWSDYSVDVGGSYKGMLQSTLIEYMQAFGIKTCIVADGINKNRITKGGVQGLDALIIKFVDDYKDEYIEKWIYSKGISSTFDSMTDLNDDDMIMTHLRRCIGFGQKRDTFLYLYENDVEFTQAWCNDYASKVRDFLKLVPDDKFNETKILFGSFFHPSDADIEKVDEIKKTETMYWELFDTIVEGVKSRYPLLFGVDTNENAVLEYVELVNDKHNQTKIQDVA